ncbi:MAG: DinB family protein [Paludibaculum sp.]
MSSLERERLAAHFEMTNRWLAQEVTGLTPAQLAFKAAPDKWSVLDVVEHLTIAEPQYWQWVQDCLKQPAGAFTRPKHPDEETLWYGIDRTERNKTAAARESKGELKDAKKGLDQFLKLRAEMLAMVKSTQEDLRGREIQKSGTDLYQWILMISVHSQRHLLQIQEIKASPGYPR